MKCTAVADRRIAAQSKKSRPRCRDFSCRWRSITVFDDLLQEILHMSMQYELMNSNGRLQHKTQLSLPGQES